MKHIIAILITAGAVGCGSLTLAHGLTDHALAQIEQNLSRPGLTPSSPLYFLDRWGEAIQEFFAFTPEAKARLQVKFAAERVAETQIMLEVRGVEAPGIEIALERLKINIEKATAEIAKEKNRGQDIEQLARDIHKQLEASIDLLDENLKKKKTFFEIEQKLEMLKEEAELRKEVEKAESGQQPAPQSAPKSAPTSAPQPQLQSQLTTQPKPATESLIQNFTIEGDDNGLYPSEIKVAKGATVKITFKTRSTGVYFGGLDFRGNPYFNSGTILPSGSKTVEFTADQSFEYGSYWPASNVLKATGKIIAE